MSTKEEIEEYSTGVYRIEDEETAERLALKVADQLDLDYNHTQDGGYAVSTLTRFNLRTRRHFSLNGNTLVTETDEASKAVEEIKEDLEQ